MGSFIAANYINIPHEWWQMIPSYLGGKVVMAAEIEETAIIVYYVGKPCNAEGYQDCDYYPYYFRITQRTLNLLLLSIS